MNEPENCPLCKVSLLGELIPEDQGHEVGARWKREIGVEHPEIYDGVYYYQCPDCLGTWLSEAGNIIENSRKC